MSIDEHPERNWDWRQPQFLAGLIRPPLPPSIPLARMERVDFTTPASDRFVWYGWSPPEPDFRWTERDHAAIVFRVDEVAALTLTIRLHAFNVPNRLATQRLDINFNMKKIASVMLDDNATHEIKIVLPAKLMQEQNLFELNLPDAASPASLNAGADERLLGVAVEWIEFQRSG